MLRDGSIILDLLMQPKLVELAAILYGPQLASRLLGHGISLTKSQYPTLGREEKARRC